MKGIKKTVNFLNPGQTVIDVCEKPLYALTKEVKWRNTEELRSSSYFSLFGGLHIQKMLFIIHGELVKGAP